MVRKATDSPKIPTVTQPDATPKAAKATKAAKAAKGEAPAPAPAPAAAAAPQAPAAGAARAAARRKAAEDAQVASPSFADSQRPAGEIPTQQRPDAAHAADRDGSFIESAAHAAGQAVRMARDTVGTAADAVSGAASNDAARNALNFASDHKGKLAIAVGVVAAPGLAITAGVVGAVAAVARGAQHLSDGKSLPDAITAVGTDVADIKATAAASWSSFKGLFKK